MKSILIVGGNDDKSIESFFNSSFNRSTHSNIFPSKEYFNQYYNSNVLNKLAYKLGFSGVEEEIGRRLIKRIQLESPDVVIVFKGMRIPPCVISDISKQCFLVMYNPDHPFIYSGKGSGNKNMTEAIPFYDLYLTYAKDIQQILNEKGIVNDRVPFGYNLKDHEYDQLDDVAEVNKLCFLGNGDEQRAKIINYLADRGIPTIVYGTNWKGSLSEKIEVHTGVYGMDFWKVMRKYRVQLNIMRPHNIQSHNMRTFDIPAAGGIQLAPDTEEHREFFNNNEIFLYQDLEDCYSKAKKILSEKSSFIEEIRKAARERCVKSNYTYENRASQMLDVIQSHYTEKG